VRREPAAYNVYTIDPPDMTLTVRAWNGKHFVTAGTSHYKEIKNTWIEDSQPRPEKGPKPPASRGGRRRK
jgi:hypothetical protein